MRKIRFFEKPAGARTVYTMAGVSFCLAAIAVGIFYSKTTDTIEKNLSTSNTTQQVNIFKDDEEDPRYNGNIPKSTTQATTEEITEEEKTEVESQKATEEESAVNATTTEEAAKQSFMLPCDGEIIREYSPEVPIYCETMDDWRTHSAVDFRVGEDEEVLSVGNGKVTRVLADSSYGYTVEVDYGEFTARYCGLMQGTTVAIDQLLNKGDSIGKVGSVPCESASGLHLHFEIIRNGDYDNPVKVLS